MLEELNRVLWGPLGVGLLGAAGLWLTVRTGWFQLRQARLWLGQTLGALLAGSPELDRQGGDSISPLQSLCTALGATIGAGSVLGVGAAIASGGPGAVFWMWVSAFLGMMTGCLEKTLTVRYREKDPAGGWRGGPMCYMEKGLGSRGLACLFALCCVCANLGGGNVVQANSIAAALEASFGWNRLAVGIVTAAVTGIVILGGIGRIGKVSEKLVPCMALLFLGGGIVVLIVHRDALPAALERIFTAALTPKAALGGGMGYGMAAAMRYGVARGVFTNEAGMGTSAIAHAASNTRDPAEQGMWGIFEVFIATICVCSVTALVILTSGVYQEGAALAAIQAGTVTRAMTGAPLSAAAFSTVYGPFGGAFVSVCLLLFAFTSLLGTSYYGERGLQYLTGSDRWKLPFRAAFLAAIVMGSVGDVAVVWQLADIFNGLMALPNLCALLALSPEALSLLKSWTKAKTGAAGRPGRRRNQRR